MRVSRVVTGVWLVASFLGAGIAGIMKTWHEPEPWVCTLSLVLSAVVLYLQTTSKDGKRKPVTHSPDFWREPGDSPPPSSTDGGNGGNSGKPHMG